MRELDQINELARKLIVPGLVDMVFKTSAIHSYLKHGMGLRQEFRDARSRARRYGYRSRIWEVQA